MDGTVSGQVAVEVGTGESMFEPLTTGQVVDIVPAPQTGTGAPGFHINVGVRAGGIHPDGVRIDHRISLVINDQELSAGSRVANLLMQGEYAVLYGLRAVLPNCYAAADRELRIRATVTDAQGRTGSDEREVRGQALCPR